MAFKNAEGYSDPTTGLAMSNIMREYRQKQRQRFNDKNRRKVYVASKYAGETKEIIKANTEDAIKYCRLAVAEGYMPIASHIMYEASGMLIDDDPEQREVGLMFSLALLKMCDEVWVFGEISPGMAAEIEEAKRLNKPVVYRDAAGNIDGNLAGEGS